MALEHIRVRQVGAGEQAVVVGAGRSGMAAVRLLLRQGAHVRLLEKEAANVTPVFRAEAEAAGVEIFCGKHRPEHFVGATYVIPSPGMPVASLLPLISATEAMGISAPEVMAEMELAWRHLKGEPLLAVTGTSGKTTTASLAAAMLRTQGLVVFLGGNIGTPLCEYVLADRRADALVVEISSFQLQTCSSFCPKVSVLLNITENHLDYHQDMREYIDAKLRLFRCQEEGDVAILHTSLRPLADAYGLKARRVWYEGGMGRFPGNRLLGAHNASNMEAAWLACRELGVSRENAARAVAAFNPLPHRLERVAEKGGVLYVNDSKCTTVSSLEVALKAFDRPVVLLCGGKFKGGDLQGLHNLVAEHVKAVTLFGASREYFEQAWTGAAPISWDATLGEAVTRAAALAARGDVVLLAPATSSFDLYSHYMARGDDFKRLVGDLA